MPKSTRKAPKRKASSQKINQAAEALRIYYGLPRAALPAIRTDLRLSRSEMLNDLRDLGYHF